MKKKSSVLVLIVASLLLIISLTLMFLYDINPFNIRFADCYTTDYYIGKTSPCTSYKYEVNGSSYDLDACGYSSTDYITKSHTVVYDVNNPSKSYLLVNIIIIIGMFALSLVLFLYRFIVLILKKLKIYERVLSIMPILMYILLLILGIFLFKNTYISKSNQVSVRSYVESVVHTTSTSNKDKMTRGGNIYALVNYEVDGKQYKRIVANVKSSAKSGDYVDLTISKNNPYRAILSHEQTFSIIYLSFLVIIGVYLFVSFIYNKVTGKVFLKK